MNEIFYKKIHPEIVIVHQAVLWQTGQIVHASLNSKLNRNVNQ